MRVIVAAVPGAGKTTVLEYVRKKMPAVKVVHVGDLIFEIAKKKFNINDKDEIREKLTVEQERFVQNYAYKKIAKMKQKIILIDTHLSIKTSSGYFPGISDHTVKLIKPDAIVVLEFMPRDVIERRRKDTTRKRDVETAEEIEEQQKLNRQLASNASALAECPVEIIDLKYKQSKPFEHAEEASEKIIKIIRR